jgi:hypothetical protein
MKWLNAGVESAEINLGPQPTAFDWWNAQHQCIGQVYHRLHPSIVDDFADWTERVNKHREHLASSFLSWDDHREAWSRDTFGTNAVRGPDGPAKHLEKEIREFFNETDPEKRKMEVIDIIFLAFDMATRSGMDFHEITGKLHGKLRINQEREWPKSQNPNEPVEHIRNNQ